MRYVCNVFTIAMAPSGGRLDYHPISTDEARTLLTNAPMGLTHAVGHEQTAKLASNMLYPRAGECLVQFARISVQLKPNDDMVLCQYIGSRLPEGVTVLPEGSEIRWYYAVYS